MNENYTWYKTNWIMIQLNIFDTSLENFYKNEILIKINCFNVDFGFFMSILL